MTLVLLASLALAANRALKVEALITKGKPATAATMAARWLEKEPNAPDAELLFQLLARARWEEIRGAPTLVSVRLWREAYGDTALGDMVLGVEAELALTEATALGSEGALWGVALQYPSTTAAGDARRRAAEGAWTKLVDAGSPHQLRAFELRYAGSDLAAKAALLEKSRAYTEATQSGDVASLQRFVDSYPEHEKIDEAREQLRIQTWREVEAGAAGVDQLWRFAGDHPDTPEGWTAAKRAFEKGFAPTLAGVALEKGKPAESPVEHLEVQLGFPPPPSFAVQLSVEVEAPTWVAWEKAATDLAPALGASGLTIESAQVTRAGALMNWTTGQPICTATVPVNARLVARLRRGAERSELVVPFVVASACPGARELVFARYGDDLDGPSARLSWIAGAWSVAPVTPSIPAIWSCSHVTATDSRGAEVACGAATVRVGWDGGLWVQQTDSAARSSSRVELLALANSRPLRVREGPKRLVDGTGAVVAGLQPGQVPAVATAPLAVAFGGIPAGRAASPAANGAVPAERGTPLPGGAEEVAMKATDTKMAAAAVKALGIDGRVTGAWMAPNKLAVLAMEGTPWGSVLLLSERGWTQVLPVASSLGEWTAFQLEGHTYLRAAGTSSTPGMRLSLQTARWGGTRWVVETADIP